MKQKILTLTTLRNSIRCEVDGQSEEDGDLIKMDKDIGLSGSPKVPFYKTPMHAIGDGWRLMAPPVHIENYAMSDNGPLKAYEWWLEK